MSKHKHTANCDEYGCDAPIEPHYEADIRALKAEIERLRTALRRAADEPNIDKARAIADEALEAKK